MGNRPHEVGGGQGPCSCSSNSCRLRCAAVRASPHQLAVGAQPGLVDVARPRQGRQVGHRRPLAAPHPGRDLPAARVRSGACAWRRRPCEVAGGAPARFDSTRCNLRAHTTASSPQTRCAARPARHWRATTAAASTRSPTAPAPAHRRQTFAWPARPPAAQAPAEGAAEGQRLGVRCRAHGGWLMSRARHPRQHLGWGKRSSMDLPAPGPQPGPAAYAQLLPPQALRHTIHMGLLTPSAGPTPLGCCWVGSRLRLKSATCGRNGRRMDEAPAGAALPALHPPPRAPPATVPSPSSARRSAGWGT